MRLSVVARAVAFVSLVATSFATSVLAAPPPIPTVVEGSGNSASGLYTAGSDGAVWALPSGAALRLTANTVVRIFPRPQSLELGGGGTTPTWSLALLQGRVDVGVPAKPRNAVLVSVDKVSAVVTTGDVGVLANDKTVLVANANGKVRTFINNRWATVEKGRMSQIDAAHPAGVDASLPPSPEFGKGTRMWLTAAEPVAVGDQSWESVAGARRYEVELRRNSVVLGRQSVTSPRVGTLARVGPGHYEAFVRTVDEHDIAGAWSAPRALRVVGVELPPGGYVENGGIYMSGGQQVRFSHTEGLEMTYVGAGKYIPASEAVGLYRNQRTIISFRFPGSNDDTIARLEPRDVYAQVFAGPKLATWPKDKIELVIRLRTRAGAPAPSFIEVVPTVHVGIEPLQVEWRRQGNDFRALIPPQASRGPWVIRVEVRDQFGIELGRDFVEVAELKPQGPKSAAVLPRAARTTVLLAATASDKTP